MILSVYPYFCTVSGLINRGWMYKRNSISKIGEFYGISFYNYLISDWNPLYSRIIILFFKKEIIHSIIQFGHFYSCILFISVLCLIILKILLIFINSVIT